MEASKLKGMLMSDSGEGAWSVGVSTRSSRQWSVMSLQERRGYTARAEDMCNVLAVERYT